MIRIPVPWKIEAGVGNGGWLGPLLLRFGGENFEGKRDFEDIQWGKNSETSHNVAPLPTTTSGWGPRAWSPGLPTAHLELIATPRLWSPTVIKRGIVARGGEDWLTPVQREESSIVGYIKAEAWGDRAFIRVWAIGEGVGA